MNRVLVSRKKPDPKTGEQEGVSVAKAYQGQERSAGGYPEQCGFFHGAVDKAHPQNSQGESDAIAKFSRQGAGDVSPPHFISFVEQKNQAETGACNGNGKGLAQKAEETVNGKGEQENSHSRDQLESHGQAKERRQDRYEQKRGWKIILEHGKSPQITMAPSRYFIGRQDILLQKFSSKIMGCSVSSSANCVGEQEFRGVIKSQKTPKEN